MSPSITCIVLPCCSFFLDSFCQPQSSFNWSELPEKIWNYRFIIEAPLYACNIAGECNEEPVLQVAEPGAVFTAVGKKNEDTLIIRFWLWKENPALNQVLCYADSMHVSRKYFLLAVKDLGERTVPRYNKNATFTAGTVLIPVKLRLQKFDFSKDFTLGPAAGVKFRLSPYMRNYVNALAGLGITSVTLDKRSTNDTVDEPMEVPALTLSLGCVLQFSNTAQAGIFCGCDYISNNDEYRFIYHGKPWISFGFGFTILSGENNVANEGERKQ